MLQKTEPTMVVAIFTPICNHAICINPVATMPFATTPFATTPFATTPFVTTPFATTPFATTPIHHYSICNYTATHYLWKLKMAKPCCNKSCIFILFLLSYAIHTFESSKWGSSVAATKAFFNFFLLDYTILPQLHHLHLWRLKMGKLCCSNKKAFFIFFLLNYAIHTFESWKCEKLCCCKQKLLHPLPP